MYVCRPASELRDDNLVVVFVEKIKFTMTCYMFSLVNKMASSEAEQTKPPSRRERAFLGQLPDDFLRIESVTTLQRPAR